MPQITVQIPRGEELSEARREQLTKDLAESPTRKLTDEERDIYARAIVEAVKFVGPFRDTLALLRPFMDATCSTAYTDRHARMGLSYWFFFILNDVQRATVILHECMHVLNNHFQRSDDMASNMSQQNFNIAGDFEINTTLNQVAFLDLTEGLLPDRDPYDYPPFKTMEHYADLLQASQKEAEKNCEACQQEKADKQNSQGSSDDSDDQSSDDSGEQGSDSESQDGDGDSEDGSGDGGDSEGKADSGSGSGASSQSGSGSKPSHSCGKGQGQGEGEPGEGGNGGGEWNCDDATEEREGEADKAGISRASTVEQTIAKQNTAARIVEEKNKGGRGTGTANSFWDSILKHLTPPKVDWRQVFRRVIASSLDSIVRGRSDYTFRRVSRRLQSPQFVFPGMVAYQPKVMLGVDTSGSMGDEDYQRALTEIEGILKEVSRGKGNVNIFSVDTRAGNIAPVNSVNKIRFTGGGGTQMAVAWKYIETLPKREKPDVFVLATDGYIDWDDVEEEIRKSRFKAVICVTQTGGFQSAPESIKKLIPVLDISVAE